MKKYEQGPMQGAGQIIPVLGRVGKQMNVHPYPFVGPAACLCNVGTAASPRNTNFP